ncbi:cytochrome-c peroxidase [Dyadobacter crusticola]|uniref:cytochrome-c peroxidase n=1 Tax=Dyadobacter crusticola TaxID=292407 RepID=UPI0004E223C2|nr:cytochrome c peroxidase [Dyadobacter crusticola]
MKKILALMSCLLFSVALTSCNSGRNASDKVYAQFLEDLNTLIARNEDFLGYVRTSSDKGELQEKFLELRLQYKKTEAFAEYFFPTTVRLVNGAPLDEVEDEENAVFEPGGLQVIEELIYTDEPLEKEELIRHVRKLQVNSKRMKMLWADIRITDTHVLDAIRLEMFRLISLGISGFDTPASGNAIAESKVVLLAAENYLGYYKSTLPEVDKLQERIGKAVKFLDQNKDFNSFDRAAFITEHINPFCEALHENQVLASIPFSKDRKLLRSDAATLFEKNAFDPEAMVSVSRFSATADRVALGRKLFFDARVSGSGKTNCGSCHNPALAYTDGLKTSNGAGKDPILRNAPTVMYAALQQNMFYDLRSPSLEDQAADVIHNTDEMRGSLKDFARMITGDKEYRQMFEKAYPELGSIRPVFVQNALATFVRSLNPFNSPFDRYMRGDKKALTDNQVAGFNVFMGKAKCGTCHFVPLFNGTVPPDYQRTESEVLGVTSSADFTNPVMDSDKGRGKYNRFPQWQHAFKTSTLRNIGKTAPYMHNGAYTTLEQVMEFYNEGGGAGLKINVPNQTLAPDKLNLTPEEIAQVIDFLESLTDQPQ